jgi:hypothetical protein
MTTCKADAAPGMGEATSAVHSARERALGPIRRPPECGMERPVLLLDPQWFETASGYRHLTATNAAPTTSLVLDQAYRYTLHAMAEEAQCVTKTALDMVSEHGSGFEPQATNGEFHAPSFTSCWWACPSGAVLDTDPPGAGMERETWRTIDPPVLCRRAVRASGTRNIAGRISTNK